MFANMQKNEYKKQKQAPLPKKKLIEEGQR